MPTVMSAGIGRHPLANSSTSPRTQANRQPSIPGQIRRTESDVPLQEPPTSDQTDQDAIISSPSAIQHVASPVATEERPSRAVRINVDPAVTHYTLPRKPSFDKDQTKSPSDINPSVLLAGGPTGDGWMVSPSPPAPAGSGGGDPDHDGLQKRRNVDHSIEITKSLVEGSDTYRPVFGRLESGPSRDNSETGGILAEFAKGNKNIAMLAHKDVKNRWLVTFSWAVFIEVFIVHMFGPLAIPWVWKRYGWISVINMSLHRIVPPAGLGTIFWMMFATMNVLYWTLPTPNVPFSEVFIATCIFLARNAIIAAKYAYFAPGQLSDLQRRIFTGEEQGAFLIVSGWHTPTLHTIRTELSYALKRTHVDLKHCFFSFQSDDLDEQISIAKKLHASFDEAMSKENRCSNWDDGWIAKINKGEVPGYLLVQSLLNEAVSANSVMYYFRLAQLAGFLHGIIPTLVRLATNPSTTFGGPPQEAIIIVFALFVSWFNIFANVMFVLVGVIDYDRRVYLMHQCSAMVTATYKIWQTGKSQLMPILNFEKAVNIANWLDIRQVMKDWGLQYFMRIQSYASLWLFFILAFVIYLVSQVILRTAELTSIVLIIFDLSIVLASLLLMVQSAKTLNQQHLEHRRILLHKLSQLQRQISKATTVSPTGMALDQSPAKIQELIDAKEMLIVAIQVMDHEDKIAPVKILGFDANDNFLRGLFGVAGSAALAAGKVLLDF